MRLTSWIYLLAIIFGSYYLTRYFHNRQNRNQSSKTETLVNQSHEPTKIVKEEIITRINAWANSEAKTKNTVVQIFSEIAEFNWLQPYSTPNQNMCTGSGFFIDSTGLIVTNAHVVNQAKSIYIQIPIYGKSQFDVELIGISFERDLALLKLTPSSLKEIKVLLPEIPFLNLGNSDLIKRGDEIMALGYPLGQESLKSTTGVVSGLESLGRPMIQVDVPINPGNSGGPSISPDGFVVGINTAGIPSAQNIGYIIPVNELKVVLEDLKIAPNKLLRRPFMGVNYQMSASNNLAQYLGNPLPGGCYVVDVYPGAILEQAGVQAGDMIYEINGLKIDSNGELLIPGSDDRMSLTDYASFWTLDQPIKMVIYRKGQKKEIDFKFSLSKLPEIRIMYPDFESIDYEVIGGMVFMQLTRNHIQILMKMIPTIIKYEEPKNQAEPVLIISHVMPGSMAQRSRVLSPGTVVSQINGRKVQTLAELREALKKSKETGFLTLKTSYEIVVALPFNDLLAQETKLSHIYHYPLSSIVSEQLSSKNTPNIKQANK